MTRSDADSWDVASSVGATATMVAAARALVSKEPNPLITDHDPNNRSGVWRDGNIRPQM